MSSDVRLPPMTPASSATVEHVALRAAAVDDEAERLRRAGDERLGDGPARGRRLGARRRPSAAGPSGRRGSGGVARRAVLACGPSAASGRVRVNRGRLAARRAQAGRAGQAARRRRRDRGGAGCSWSVEPHSSTAAPAGSRSTASGTTARASAAASALSTWLPWPAGEPEADPAAVVAHGSAVAVALGHDAQEGPPAGRLRHRLEQHAGIARSRSRRRCPARRRIAGRTNSSNVTNAADRVARQPEEQDGGRRRAGATPNANGLPGWTATRHRSTRPTASKAALDDVVRADRHAAGDDDARRPRSSPARSRASTSSRSSRAIPRSSDRRAGGGDERPEPGSVGVGDAGRSERLARGSKLVAGGQDRDARAAGGRPRRPHPTPPPGRSRPE